MIDRLKPYPAYVDSGVPWLGRIPEKWEVRRNGRLFVERKETGFPDLPILEVSLRTGVRVRNFDASERKQVMSDRDKYKRACKDDIAYNMMRMWQGAVGIAPVDGLISPAYVVARPLPGTTSAYFAHLFQTAAYMGEINNYSRGIVADRNRLYWDEFKQIPTPHPPPAEQTAIVRFIGHVEQRVQRYIKGKRRLIGLLAERKQALIDRAVTRGLDPNVRLKPSGVELLGNIPEHWQLVQLRRYWRVTDCKHLTVPFVEDGIPLASVREVQSFELDLGVARKTTAEWFDHLVSGGRRPKRGDLIYCRNVSVGACAYVNTDDVFAMGQDVCLIRSNTENQRYLNYLFRSWFIEQQLAQILIGSTFDRINISEIKSLTVLVPPRSEQDSIVDHLDAKAAAIDSSIACAEREIKLIQEFRTRLAADVVIGKLDVRAAAAALPDAEPADAADDVNEVADIGDGADDLEIDEAAA